MYKYLLLLILLTPVIVLAKNVLPISLQVNQIEVRQLLQLLADYRHLNIVMSDGIKGKMTLHVQGLPWTQVLNIVLQQNALTAHYQGNVLMITPINEWLAQEASSQQVKQTKQTIENLQAMFLPLHYAKADYLQNLLKESHELSTRGIVIADNRTNGLWIQGIPENMASIRLWIKQLDTPVKQILIKARIVNLNASEENELGVQFNVNRQSTTMTNPLQALSVDLPVMATNAGRLGLMLTKLGGDALLDLQLSALAKEGKGEIIARPELMTDNGQPATILAGQEVPYQQSTTSGATSVHFQKAVLSLTVTPQLLANKKILLNLHLNQDQPTATLMDKMPTIATRQIQTQVMVNNQQTIVLGGIYEKSVEQRQEHIPFLSAVPIVGKLFQYQALTKHRRELLIFITPKIIP